MYYIVAINTRDLPLEHTQNVATSLPLKVAATVLSGSGKGAIGV